MRIEKKLVEMGLELPAVEPNTRSQLIPAVKVGSLLFCSGAGPAASPGKTWRGKVGRDYTTEEAYEAAKWCAVALLASAKSAIGDLDRVKRVVKVLGMVNATEDFEETPQVIHGASDLFVSLFGEMGRHARSAVGMAALPGGIPVEVEVILEVE